MTDIRKCAQAVIDDFQFMRNAIDEKLWESIEALRQALAEPEPSVDALIAEIDALDRHGDDADFIYGWDINPILDKYRGAK